MIILDIIAHIDNDSRKKISKIIKENNRNLGRHKTYTEFATQGFAAKGNELLDMDIPEYIKQNVQNKIFDYLDEIGLEYVKAGASNINHYGKLITTIISFPGFAKRVNIKALQYNDSEIWRTVDQLLPGAIIHKIKEEIDQVLNLNIPASSLRTAPVGYGPENLKDYTVLFKDFSEKIMQIPASPTDPLYGNESRIHGGTYSLGQYSVSTYFDIVHKSQHGITPILTNELVKDTIHREKNIIEKSVAKRYPSIDNDDMFGDELDLDTGHLYMEDPFQLSTPETEDPFENPTIIKLLKNI